MNVFKRIYRKIFGGKRDKKAKAKEQECWYNNAHENGEAIQGSVPIEAGGSENFLEAAVTKSCVKK